jgi:hypothetical protein
MTPKHEQLGRLTNHIDDSARQRIKGTSAQRVPKAAADDIATAAALKGMTKTHLAHCARLNALAKALGEEPVLEALIEYSIRAEKNEERRFVRRLTLLANSLERLHREGRLPSSPLAAHQSAETATRRPTLPPNPMKSL